MWLNKASNLFGFVHYLIFADNKHGVHSPFVFNFITQVLENKKMVNSFYDIELIRQKMLHSRAKIEVVDFGAKGGTYTLSLSELCNKTSKSAKYGRLLHNIVQYFAPQTTIELGTSLGISTMYMASGIKKDAAVLYSLEGNPSSAQIARYNIEKLGVDDKTKIIEGNFNLTLPLILREIQQVDVAFIDGNHKKEPTLQYFAEILTKAHNETVFIFDDIRWSDEMEEAWLTIRNHPSVTVSIDLFFMGIVFIRKEQVKEHFVIRF